MEQVVFKDLLVKAHAYCMPRLKKQNLSDADAEDAFMEAMYLFWKDEQAGKVKHSQNLPALIYVMAKNIWLMQKRKAKRGQFKEYATDPADLNILEKTSVGLIDEESFNTLIRAEQEQFELAEQQERELAFQQAFQQLTDQCRTLLMKFIVEKVRLKELQTLLGFPSADAVKMAKYRCKRNLVKHFKSATSK